MDAKKTSKKRRPKKGAKVAAKPAAIESQLAQLRAAFDVRH